MFDASPEATYWFLGLATASLVLVGVATDLPTRPPPDAAAAANTVDALAASDHAGTATHPIDATAVRVTPGSVSLRASVGATHATFAFGPVTPAPPDSALAAVARGVPPGERFDSPEALAAAAAAAREDATTADWRPAPDSLRVRRVNWGDVRVTLVLA
jgi:hypothetical protein